MIAVAKSTLNQGEGAEITVRLKNSQEIKGKLLAVRDSALVISLKHGQSVKNAKLPKEGSIALHFGDIEKVSIDGESHVLSGMGWGTLIGGGIGVLAGLASGTVFKRKLVQPHDHPVEASAHHISRLAVVFTILLVLWPYTVSFGDNGVSFSLINGTPHYLHAVISGKSFVYIAPGRVIAYELPSYADVIVDVSYSPGQGVKGNTSKIFPIVVVSTYSNDCSNNQSQNNACTNTI